MKLYLAAGLYVGTQTEARECDRLFTPVEFPTGKEELIAALNGIVDNTREIYASRQVAAQPPAPPAPRAPDTVARDITVEEAIGEADHARAIRLAEHIHCRLMELARAGTA